MLDFTLRLDIDNEEIIYIRLSDFNQGNSCVDGRNDLHRVLGDNVWRGTRREASEACLCLGLGRHWWWGMGRFWTRDLTFASLGGADLSRADLYAMGWKSVDFTRAYLAQANLHRANLRWATLRGASLRGANVSNAKLCNADLRDSDLQGANLREADLTGADLTNANLTGCSLQGALLDGTELRGAYRQTKHGYRRTYLGERLKGRR